MQHNCVVVKTFRTQRARSVATILITIAMSGVFLSVPNTLALYSGSQISTNHAFDGATFTPSVAPVVSKIKVSGNMNLSWPVVSISSGASITYVVRRRSNQGLVTVICTAPGAISISSGMASCIDTSPGPAPSYSEQPTVIRGSQTTWSLPASTLT